MLGHEITHVLNRDVVVMTIASFFASIAAFITQFGFFFGGGFGGNNRNNNNNNGFFVVILVSAGGLRRLVPAAPGALPLP